MMGPSEAVYVENRRGPIADPWGTRDQLMFCVYLPSPGHPERATSEIAH